MTHRVSRGPPNDTGRQRDSGAAGAVARFPALSAPSVLPCFSARLALALQMPVSGQRPGHGAGGPSYVRHVAGSAEA